MHFRENWIIFWGEAKLIFVFWGAKAKSFQGAEEILFRDFGRSMHYFLGAREHRSPSPWDSCMRIWMGFNGDL